MEVLPINLTAVVAVVMGCLIVLIPIAGFTARFAIKPITEALARARESGSSTEAVAMLERRTALVEQELQHLSGMREEMTRLREELEFQRKLASPASEPRG
jgi:hypothetical protein